MRIGLIRQAFSAVEPTCISQLIALRCNLAGPVATMPRRVQNYDDYGSAVQQIILSTSDAEFLDQLIPVLKDATATSRATALTQNLSQYAEDREAEIERIGLTKHEEFLDSVNHLQNVRERTVALTADILELNQSIQASTEKLAEQKQALVNTRAVRENISDVSDALKESLKILHAVNNAHDLIRKKKYYAALKSLDDLQNEFLIPIIQNSYATQHQLANLIQKSIPASQKTISEAVMTDLNTWLFRIRETSQFLGEVAFYHTEMRRTRQRERAERDEFLNRFKLNSAIELVFDESEEFDVLDNEELKVCGADLISSWGAPFANGVVRLILHPSSKLSISMKRWDKAISSALSMLLQEGGRRNC